jgi:hypothetical protein
MTKTGLKKRPSTISPAEMSDAEDPEVTSKKREAGEEPGATRVRAGGGRRNARLLLCAALPLFGLQAVAPPRPEGANALPAPQDAAKVLPSGTADAEAGAALRGAAPIIVIGFVGGYVRHDNGVHSVVQIAERLRKAYPEGVAVLVFENHHRAEAHQEILRLLSGNQTGKPTDEEKKNAKIIIYGHSWGGSETVTLARQLEKDGIPVLLTVQVDSVRKRHEDDGTIPVNVAEAANFYQLDGFLHGRNEIVAEDPARTEILGNYHFQYKEHPITCDSPYPWYNRLFMKAHTEIECDPNVWDKVQALIRSKLPAAPLGTTPAS